MPNPGNGAVLLIRFSDYPDDPSKVGEEEVVFFNEVREVVE